MKTRVLLIGITAVLATACGQTKFNADNKIQGKALSSSAEQQGESDPNAGMNGGDAGGSGTQTAETAAGAAHTYAQSMCKWALLNPDMFVLVSDGIKITGSVGNFFAKGHHVADIPSL